MALGFKDVNAQQDRHLMGEKIKRSTIGEIWVVRSPDGGPDIVKVNPIVCKKLGYQSTELERMKIADLMTRDSTKQLHYEKYFRQAFDSTETVRMKSHGQGFEMLTKEGEKVSVLLAIIFLKKSFVIDGQPMIPECQRAPFVFGCLEVVFIEDYSSDITLKKNKADIKVPSTPPAK